MFITCKIQFLLTISLINNREVILVLVTAIKKASIFSGAAVALKSLCFATGVSRTGSWNFVKATIEFYIIIGRTAVSF